MGAPPVLAGRPRLLVLLCVSVPSFMINLDANIVAVSLPAIAHALKADFADIEWVVSAYTLSFAALVMPAGALADRYGRKRMLILGLAVFTLASLLCGAAGSAVMLNGARALQGAGAALQLSAALASLSHAFRGRERARAFAFWGSLIGIAITLAPVAGGLITATLGWRWVFYVNLPVGALMILMTWRWVAPSRDPEATRLDLPGVLLFSAGLFCLTLALIGGNRQGWSSGPILAELMAAALLLAGFLVAEAVQARPMIDLAVFRRPTYLGATIAGLALAASLLAMLSYLPIYFQGGLGLAPQRAGLAMLPLALPLFVVPRLVQRHLGHRLSGRGLLAGGLAILAAGLTWLAAAAPELSYSALLGGLLTAGIGAGVLNGETAKVAMSVIPPERAGMASGIGGTVRFTGIVVGFAVLGAVLAGTIAAAMTQGLGGLGAAGAGLDHGTLIRQVVAGDVAGAARGLPAGVGAALHGLALAAFGQGFRAILACAAAFAALSAALSWWLVRDAETAPAPAALAAVVRPPID